MEIYNAGTANSILNMPANSFAIKNHDNNIDGDIPFIIDLTNKRVGIDQKILIIQTMTLSI